MKEKTIKDWTIEEIVRVIARKYDDNTDYSPEWKELVERVGPQEAERLVDQA